MNGTGIDYIKDVVHRRVYERMHTERIDGDISTVEILGIGNTEGSLLDPDSEVWDNYGKDIETKEDAGNAVLYSILALEEEGKITVLRGGGAAFLKVERPKC